MLAYVFWHWPNAAVDVRTYEKAVADFHAALAAAKPAGFVRSAVFQTRAPWIGRPDGGYEEWYLLENSGAMDVINEAVVSAACREPHDHVARLAGGGTASLYRLRRGVADPDAQRWCAWFEKPAAMKYAEFDALLRPLTDAPRAGLWSRQMGLGSTPEFCLRTPGPLEGLPAPPVTVAALELIRP